MKLRKGGLAALAIVGGGLATGAVVATATHTPADKPFAAASKTVRFSEGSRVELLSATVKNSKTTDMVFQLSMECSIITDNVIAGSPVPGTEESASSSGRVRTWIEVDGQIVPIMSASSPPQTPPSTGGNETDKVTFCNRVFERTVSDQESPMNGIDYSRDYIETKDANAFNWVRLNMGSGIHTIKVFADMTHDATPGSSASAYVGNRSLIGLPGKFANDAVISEAGTG